MIQRILVAMLLVLPLASLAAGPDANRSDWVYLQNGPSVRISLETGHARKGWTPVTVSLAGTAVSLQMDPTGRVYPDRGIGAAARMTPLFVIDIGAGVIRLGDRSYSINVFEQNAVRTRFMLTERTVELPLDLDGRDSGATLYFGRLKIPARMRAVGLAGSDASAGPGHIAEPRPGGNGKGATAVLSASRIRSHGK